MATIRKRYNETDDRYAHDIQGTIHGHDDTRRTVCQRELIYLNIILMSVFALL